MTRVILLVAWSILGLLTALGAILTAASESWPWAVVLAGLAIQSCMGIQLVIHGARLDRLDDVIGAWRRQDPNAWRRE